MTIRAAVKEVGRADLEEKWGVVVMGGVNQKILGLVNNNITNSRIVYFISASL